jgi:hypothetical protein
LFDPGPNALRLVEGQRFSSCVLGLYPIAGVAEHVGEIQPGVAERTGTFNARVLLDRNSFAREPLGFRMVPARRPDERQRRSGVRLRCHIVRCAESEADLREPLRLVIPPERAQARARITEDDGR